MGLGGDGSPYQFPGTLRRNRCHQLVRQAPSRKQKRRYGADVNKIMERSRGLNSGVA